MTTAPSSSQRATALRKWRRARALSMGSRTLVLASIIATIGTAIITNAAPVAWIVSLTVTLVATLIIAVDIEMLRSSSQRAYERALDSEGARP